VSDELILIRPDGSWVVLNAFAQELVP
jgi:hypothetical protein